jgi:hypothetical protein
VLHFDEENHKYTVDGVVVPSVTQLLRPISPDFERINPEVLERKRALGSAVHLACELDDTGELDDVSTHPEVFGYVLAWRKFKSDTGAAVLMNEQRLYHRTLRFAGTLDRLVQVRNGDVYLIDLKTSISMHDSYGVQLAGYQLLIDDDTSIPTTKLARKGLQLKADGAYKLVPYDNHNDEACFRALLAIHNWSNTK